MGLSAPKNKFKLSADPNNNNWSRNTARFGHKILTSQGWTPGSYLGNASSSHAEHHTQANLSHIKVLLKDDNLGLGAKRGSDKAENFGMAGFNDILSRLNGKSEEKILEEKGKRRDAELKVFQAGRWGRMVFVSGGFLVGDRIEKLKEKLDAEKGEAMPQPIEGAKSKKKSTKRKREQPTLEAISETAEVEPKLKRKKRKSDLKALEPTVTIAPPEEPTIEVNQSESIKSKKSKKSKASRSTPPTEDILKAEPRPPHLSKAERRAQKAAEKEAVLKAAAAEKEARRARKASRRERRKQKELEHTANPSPNSPARSLTNYTPPEAKASIAEKKVKRPGQLRSPGSSVPASGDSDLPSSTDPDAETDEEETEEEPDDESDDDDAENSGGAPKLPVPAVAVPKPVPTIVPTYSTGRHMARRRFIQAKAMAIADPQAMREIFMVKSAP